jgi:hypothetical protein
MEKIWFLRRAAVPILDVFFSGPPRPPPGATRRSKVPSPLTPRPKENNVAGIIEK